MNGEQEQHIRVTIEQPEAVVPAPHVVKIIEVPAPVVPVYQDPTVIVGFIGLLTAIVTGYFGYRRLKRT